MLQAEENGIGIQDPNQVPTVSFRQSPTSPPMLRRKSSMRTVENRVFHNRRNQRILRGFRRLARLSPNQVSRECANGILRENHSILDIPANPSPVCVATIWLVWRFVSARFSRVLVADNRSGTANAPDHLPDRNCVYRHSYPVQSPTTIDRRPKRQGCISSLGSTSISIFTFSPGW